MQFANPPYVYAYPKSLLNVAYAMVTCICLERKKSFTARAKELHWLESSCLKHEVLQVSEPIPCALGKECSDGLRLSFGSKVWESGSCHVMETDDTPTDPSCGSVFRSNSRSRES